MVQLLSGFKEPELAKTLFIGQALHGLLFQMQKINNDLLVCVSCLNSVRIRSSTVDQP